MSVTPIMLRLQHGRCGSTLLMQLLTSSPNVLGDRQYPFEHRYLSYFYRLSQLVNQPVNRSVWHDGNVLDGELPYVGPMPYDNISVFDQNQLANEIFKSTWKSFAKILRESNGHAFNPDLPVYYAEKVAPGLPDFIEKANIKSRSIFIVRDPRDIFLSVKRFNEKRGYLAFGWEEKDTDATYVARLCQKYKEFLREYNKNKISKKVYKIRYEDIAINPHESAEEISAWLGVELSYGAVAANLDKFAHHITTTSLAASCQRWKDEMDPAIIARFADSMGDELAAAGYEC